MMDRLLKLDDKLDYCLSNMILTGGRAVQLISLVTDCCMFFLAYIVESLIIVLLDVTKRVLIHIS